MNVRGISALKSADLIEVRRPHDILNSAGPTLLVPTRRQFARAVAGAAVVGTTIGSEMWLPRRAEATSFAPVPIPGGTPVLGGSYHVFGPGVIDPVDAEPSTITNFNGFVGLAFITGMVTRTNTSTGQTLRLPFVDNDMRFMTGVFKATDGRIHRGAFAFI
jgi:hypothetical protein